MNKWLCMICIGILMTSMTACSSGGSGELASTEKPVSKEGQTVVTLSMQQSSAFYQAAEKKFEEKYPDIDLQIQITDDYQKYQKRRIQRYYQERPGYLRNKQLAYRRLCEQ